MKEKSDRHEEQLYDINDAMLTITHVCNNNCVSCVIHTSANNPSFKACALLDDLENHKKTVRRIAEYSDHIEINGGEPTISKNLMHVLRHIYSVKPGMEVKILSNGRRFKNRKFLDAVFVSSGGNAIIATTLYGPAPEVHDRITQVPGSFNETLTGIQNLLTCGIRVELRIIINRINYRYLGKICSFIQQYFHNLDFLRISFTSMKITGTARKNKEIVACRITDTVEFLSSGVKELSKKKYPVELYHFPYCILPEDLRLLSVGITAEKNQIVFPERCTNCSAREACSGIWRSYISLYGENEFSPLL